VVAEPGRERHDAARDPRSDPDDPIGGWWFEYGRSVREVERCVRGLLERVGRGM